MNFLDQQPRVDGGWTRDEGPDPHPPRPKALQRAETLDESRLYRKRIAPSTGNGSLGGLGRKILQRQSSVVVNFPSEPSPNPLSVSGGGPPSASGFWPPRRSSSAGLATEKLLAAKQRKQDSLDKENARPAKKSWSSRLKVFATVCVSTLLILVGSSLLFISLLVVDPILVGLKAQFRNQPGICRTSEARHLVGPGNCEMPSCREGCTADLYTCTFLYVSYIGAPALNFTFVQSYYNQEIQDWDPGETLADEFLPLFRANQSTNISYIFNNTDNNNTRNILTTGTLMINPNGCGYPPEVNCSDFFDRFGDLGTLFPCFYSDSLFNNGSAVLVPFYDRTHEIVNLGLYCGIPLGTVLVLSLFLLLLTKLKIPSKRLPPLAQIPDVENQPPRSGRRTPYARNGGNDSTRLIDIDKGSDSPVEASHAEELPERLNGHGPKKKVLTPPHSSTSIFQSHSTNEKTDATTTGLLRHQVQVQGPPTSRILPEPNDELDWI